MSTNFIRFQIFLMPSIYEPFGQTTLEANASGIEIVGIKPSKKKKKLKTRI